MFLMGSFNSSDYVKDDIVYSIYSMQLNGQFWFGYFCILTTTT